MNQEINVELKDIRQELQKINHRLDGVDQRLDSGDQRFDKIDQRFDKLDQRLDTEFQIVHTSINKIAVDLYKKCLHDDHKHAELKAMFDTFMHRTSGMESVPMLNKKVDSHELRISNLEATRKD